ADATRAAREAVVKAQLKPSERGEARQEPEDQPDADGRLAEGLERREQVAARQHRFLEESLVPIHGIASGELGDPLGLESEEARGSSRGWNHAPEVREGELGPPGLDEHRDDDD